MLKNAAGEPGGSEPGVFAPERGAGNRLCPAPGAPDGSLRCPGLGAAGSARPSSTQKSSALKRSLLKPAGEQAAFSSAANFGFLELAKLIFLGLSSK